MKLIVRTLEWLFVLFMIVVVLYWLAEDWVRGRKIGSMDFEEES